MLALTTAVEYVAYLHTPAILENPIRKGWGLPWTSQPREITIACEEYPMTCVSLICLLFKPHIVDIDTYKVWSKYNRYFRFFQKVFIYLSIGMIQLCFQCIVIHPWFVTSYDLLEQIWVVVNISWTKCPCVVFTQNFAIFKNLRCRMFHA